MRVCIRCRGRLDDGWGCVRCGYSPRVGDIVEFVSDHEGTEALSVRSFHDLEGVESGSFWFRSRNSLITWAMRRYFPQARTFFEIGCGTGFVLQGLGQALPQLDLAGGELSTAGLAVARRRLPGVRLYALNGRLMPFEDEFDVIGAFDVIEHVDDDIAFLTELRQVVRPGGGLLLSVPQHRWLWSALDDYSGHRRRYDAPDVAAKLSRAGFQVLRRTSFVALLLPLLVASRIAKRRAAELDPLAEFRTTRRLGRLLEGVQSLELALVARGVSFPLGGSLFVVARRIQ